MSTEINLKNAHEQFYTCGIPDRFDQTANVLKI